MNSRGTKKQEPRMVLSALGIYRVAALVLVEFRKISEIESLSSDCGAS